ASRLACMNNMQNMGLAFHHYHSLKGSFPTEGGNNQSFYLTLAPYVEGQNAVNSSASSGTSGTAGTATAGNVAPLSTFLCPSRRSTNVGAKRDYGYASSNRPGAQGPSILDSDPIPASLDIIMSHDGAAKKALLTELWMAPSTYLSGDPTDQGYATKNNGRTSATYTKSDGDPTGDTTYLGGPHPKGTTTLWADGHVSVEPFWSYTTGS